MLAAVGDQSFQLADRLRGEMEKLFGQCQGGNCPSGNELDSYLRLQRMSPGNNFAQMARSRKFGFGNGRGQAGGMGEGQMGTSGYAVVDGSTLGQAARAPICCGVVLLICAMSSPALCQPVTVAPSAPVHSDLALL